MPRPKKDEITNLDTEIPVESSNALTAKDKIEQAIAQGYRCSRVQFHATVDSASGEPEYRYYSEGVHRASRKAEIYYTNIGVILIQGKRHEIVPLAGVKQATPIV